MSSGERQAQVREAVGVFVEPEALKSAAEALLDAGFSRDSLGLLAGQDVVERSLAGLYAQRTERGEDAGAPETDFVRHETIGDAVHAYVGGVSLAGTTALGAGVVASAAVLGGALVAATAGAAAVGVVGAAMGAILHKDDAEYLEEQLEDGRLLLFVRADEAAREPRAADILGGHGAIDTKVLTVSRPGA